MAPPPPAAGLAPLRALAAALTAVPDDALPAALPAHIGALYAAPVLESAFRSASEDAAVLLHKLRARVSALLQSRAPQGRWAGAALVGACVGSSRECLAAHAKTWAPLVLALLGRPEPTPTLVLALATLSRIFNSLAVCRPSLAREITSPNLKSYLECALSLLSPPSSNRSSAQPSAPAITDDPALLPACLRALAQTLSAHPTTFRPFVKRTRSIVAALLALPHTRAPRSGDAGGDRTNTASAVAAEWSRTLKCVLSDTHAVLDDVFAPILEDPALRGTLSPSDFSLSFPPPSPSTTLDRALLFLHIISTFFSLPTSAPVTAPLGHILLLTRRILSVSSCTSSPNPIHPTSSRDTLFARLPALHTATLNLLDTIVRRLSGLFVPVAMQTLEQVVWSWDGISAAANIEVRTAGYVLLDTLLRLCGRGIPRTHAIMKKVMKIADGACEDIAAAFGGLSDDRAALVASAASEKTAQGTVHHGNKRKKHKTNTTPSSNTINTNPSTLADALLQTQSTSIISNSNPFPTSPHPNIPSALLTTLLASSTHIPSELRTKIDRLAVMTGNQEMMLASVLWPAGWVKASLVTHLVGAGQGVGAAGGNNGDIRVREMATQALVWPRMPVVRADDGEEEEDEGDASTDEEEGDDGEGTKEMDIDASSTSISIPQTRQEQWQNMLQAPTALPPVTTTTAQPPPPEPSQPLPPPPPPPTPPPPSPKRTKLSSPSPAPSSPPPIPDPPSAVAEPVMPSSPYIDRSRNHNSSDDEDEDEDMVIPEIDIGEDTDTEEDQDDDVEEEEEDEERSEDAGGMER
ncbi:rRNA processing/ribosome biogenesis-domain-containing protein [Kalaharituber pfeilii]|nr:rRNA processing/ribosome biogenesis-domain-containing protein [Kalaharituber pfeilii]